QDSTRYGKLQLIFNKKPEMAQLTYEDLGQQVYYQYEQDTIWVWHDWPNSTTWPLYVQSDTLQDTIQMSNALRDTFLNRSKLTPTSNLTTSAIALNPAKSLRLSFNHPLQQLDTARIRLFEDSIKTQVRFQMRIDSAERQETLLTYPWKEKVLYELLLLPGAFTDWYGLVNTDTIRQRYQVSERTDFGDIKLRLEDIAKGKNYLLQLLFKNDNLVEEFAVNGDQDSIVEKSFLALPPGDYSLRVVEDRNNNQRWDTGNYDRGEQPERQAIRPIEELRASWEVESTISLQFKK
ncbi:MAG: hypothetical protein AAGD05_18320, partial [Bacteroidota bacterium]